MSAPAASVAAAEPEHVHHPNADGRVEFKGLAAYEKKGEVKPFSYNPPKLTSDFVEIDIICCGICGSDIHTIDSGWGPSNYPVIVGHEIVGTVVAVGSDVRNVRVGQRVGVGAQCGACMNKRKETPCDPCMRGWEQCCSTPGALLHTYNKKRPDGQVTQGGYADRIRVQCDFVFDLPAQLSSHEAAPLLCGGVTVFAPLQRFITRKGMRVGVIGIGGLGHLAVKFAAKLIELQGGGMLTAISHNSKKKSDSLAMGAHAFIDTSDKSQFASARRTFDLVICTANGRGQDWNNWLTILDLHGTFCVVSAPEEPLQFPIWNFLSSQINFCGSGIGSIVEIQQMLSFAARWNITPIVERLPMSQANEGIARVRDGRVRYRVVLENPNK